MKKKNNINFFFDLPLFNKLQTFLTNTYNIKTSFNILYTSSITEIYLSKRIDLILPITNLIENFNIFKNYQGFIIKSLFIKNGPWLSKNIITYFNIFFSIRVYPYLWILNINKYKFIYIYLYLKLWLKGISKLSFFIKKKKVLSFDILISKKIYSYKNFFTYLLLQKTNFWASKIDFIKSSKYSKLGLNLINKISKTYQMF